MKKHKAKSNDTLSEQHSFSKFLLLGFLTALFFFSPFYKGLFNGGNPSSITAFIFNQPIYTTLLFASLAMFIFTGYTYKYMKFQDKKDILHLLVWLIPLSFLISKISAASPSLSTNMLFIYMFYAFIFIVGAYLSSFRFAYYVQTLILGSGGIIITFGLMNWLGDASLMGLISYENHNSNMYRDAVLIDSNGERLTSVFQYANTYAAYLIALLLSFAYALVNTRKRGIIITLGLLLVPTIVSFILTLSRGGIVVFPIILLIILPLLNMIRQVWLILYLALAGAAAFLIINPITTWGINLQKDYSYELNLKAWGLIIGVSLITSLIIYLLQYYVSPHITSKVERITKLRFSNLFIPILLILLGGGLALLLLGNSGFVKMLPDHIQARVENINLQQHSVLERITFYKDANKLISDYPLIGAGGGAWSTLYEQYQNNPYTSRQAHNFFLQYLISVGYIGFVIFLVLLIGLFILFLRNYFKNDDTHKRQYGIFFIITISILTHSMIDFNMSYVYIGALVFLCLGSILAGINQNPFDAHAKLTHKTSKKFKIYYTCFLTILSLILLIFSSSMLIASNYYETAYKNLQQHRPINEIIEPLDRAIKIRAHPDYLNLKFQLMMQLYSQTKEQVYLEESEKLFNKLKTTEPNNRVAFENGYKLLMTQSKKQDALSHLENGLNMYVWDISVHQRVITLSYDLGYLEYKQSAQVDNSYWTRAIEVYKMVENKVNDLERLPEEQAQGRKFAVSFEMSNVISHIYLLNKDFEQAEKIALINMNNNLEDASQRSLNRLYAAALLKQGKPIHKIYEQYLQTNVDEKAAFEQLIKELM